MKKVFKKVVIVMMLCSIIISSISIYARDISEDNIEEPENRNVVDMDFSDYTTSTLNIRCYVPESMKEAGDTIYVSLFNIDEGKGYDLYLYSTNDYFESVNIPIGNYSINGTVYEGYIEGYSFYCEKSEFELTQYEPYDVVCVYGDEEYINTYEGKTDAIDIYTDESSSEVVEYLNEVIQIDENGNEIIETEETVNTEEFQEVTEKEDDSENDSQSNSNLFKYIVILTACIIIFSLLMLSIFKKKKRKM